MVAQIAAVLPVYNGQKYLSEAISSVFRQDTDDWTLYIINDGSTDSTSEIIENWKEKYPNKIEVYHLEKNKGAAYASNVGLRNSRHHPYVIIINSDDIQVKRRFSTLLRKIKKDDVDIVMHDCETIDRSGQALGTTKGFESTVINQKNVFAEQLKRNYFWNGLVMFKNSDDILFDPELTISEDYDLFIRLFYKGATFSYINKSLLLYRLHDDNLSSNHEKSEKIFRQIFDKYREEDIEQKIQNVYDHYGEECMVLAQVCIYKQNWAKAMDYIDKGIQQYGQPQETYCNLYFMKGYILYTRQNIAEALVAYGKANEYLPDNPTILNNIGVMHYLINKNREHAQLFFEHALKLEPRYNDALINLKVMQKGLLENLKVTRRVLRKQLIK